MTLLARVTAAAARAIAVLRGPRAPIPGERRFNRFMLQEEQRSLRVAAYVRFVFVAILLSIELFGVIAQPFPISLAESAYSILMKLAFLPVGFVQLRQAASPTYHPWTKYVLLAADVALLAVYQIVPNPWTLAPGSPIFGPEFVALATRFYENQTLKWLWLFYVWVAFNFSANYVRAFSAYVALAWAAQLVWVLSLPGTFHQWNAPPEIAGLGEEALRAAPGYVNVALAIDSILATLFMAIGFVYVAGHSRRLITRFFASEERRGALARYFSPNLVDRLAETDAVPPRSRSRAAILFVDIRGFTRLVDGKPPDAVLDLLQAFHSRAEAEIFARDGTLEKYIGDAVMAVFGAPVARDDDADRALACALALLARMEDWSRERRAEGAPAVRVGIGLDYGDVVGGVIGRQRNMAYAVVGGAVNAASRLQGLTRDFDVDLVFSERFRAALRDDRPLAGLEALARREGVAVRGLPAQDLWSARYSGSLPTA